MFIILELVESKNVYTVQNKRHNKYRRIAKPPASIEVYGVVDVSGYVYLYVTWPNNIIQKLRTILGNIIMIIIFAFRAVARTQNL